jgi:hypothetical protein
MARRNEGNMANKAYDIVIRRISTGTDFHIRLFAPDSAKAIDRAYDRARFSCGIRLSKYRELCAEGYAVFRCISYAVSTDQSRPIES